MELGEDQNTHFAGTVGTFFGSEDIVSGPHNFKGLLGKLVSMFVGLESRV